ncbi:MAG: tRNA (adenosine(37)-N6)-threonylcarbamoyltransferase complex ATPase subunit type 1 TsaE [Oscillospiraceae bacterium]|nr:tRNA (adenosine(37)-N6)-threonylcarbamoyltransferase complex ATPase subunit type 1 TsaE [Oscillospiraceae bacterium]
MTVLITENENETVLEGEKLGVSLKERIQGGCAGNNLGSHARDNPGGCAVVALYGGLGAGKTAFTRGIAAGLGIKMNVTSPTFTIVNEYPGDIPLFHFDMYRLESENELFDIGWDDYQERSGVCVVEWSEKVPGAFPPDTIDVYITVLGENRRQIEIKPVEPVKPKGAEPEC